MRKYLWGLCGVLGWSFVSLGCGQGKEASKPLSTGQPYEVLVVMDETQWKDAAGRALFRVLDTDVPGLPQSERSFRILYTSPERCDASLSRHRNILLASVCDTLAGPVLTMAQDVHAAPQTILRMQAPDETSFLRLAVESGQAVIDCFTQAERERQVDMLARRHRVDVAAKADSLFGCRVWVPEALKASKTGVGFYWVGTNAATDDRNFVMYACPYQEGEAFTKDFFVHKRDSVMKANIPGAREGIYMATNGLLTTVRPIRVQGGGVWEMRGLWQMKGDFMGGPFVAHVRADTVNRRLVVAEVFVYAPNRLKRDLIRRLEASLYTLEWPDGQREKFLTDVDSMKQ